MMKKKNLEKKVSLANRIISKPSSFINSASFAHSTIDSIVSISSKKPTYFSYSFSAYGESNNQSPNYLLNKKIEPKEGFKTSL